MATEILTSLVTKHLTAIAFKHATDQVVLLAESRLPGATDEEKKTWCADQLLKALEVYDNRLPVIGDLLDIPVSDQIEKWAVNYLVEGAFVKMKTVTGAVKTVTEQPQT